MLLSRMSLDLLAGASHRTKSHPIETPHLSSPCPMRVDLTETRREAEAEAGLPETLSRGS